MGSMASWCVSTIHYSQLQRYISLFFFFSNAFRIFSIRIGAVQNHSFLFCQNPAKRAAVARRHFVAWEYHVFLRVSSFHQTYCRADAMVRIFLPRVGCVLVFNNLMVVVSLPREKYQSLALTSFECKTQIPWFGFGSVCYLLKFTSVSCQIHACSPFHAALGIVTCRMLIHLRKFASGNLEVWSDGHSLSNLSVDPLELAPFRHSPIEFVDG